MSEPATPLRRRPSMSLGVIAGNAKVQR